MLKALLAMDKRLDRIAAVHINGCRFLGQRLEFAKDEARCMGFGDDGIVLVKGNTAIKLFRMVEADNKVSEYVNRIRHDQAYREFKALSLVTPHPNFPKVVSTELDTCTAWVGSENPNVNAWAVQMEYIAGAVRINGCTRLWGLVPDLSAALCFDFNHRNQNLQDIMDQLVSAVMHMSGLKIRHRDLDMCNIMVRIADLQLFILDFARAALPNSDERFEQTEDPVELMGRSMTYGSAFYEADVKLSDKKDISDEYVNSYTNIYGKRFEDDPSDLESIERLLTNLFRDHVCNDLIFDSIQNTESFESENTKTRKRIENTLLPKLRTEASDDEDDWEAMPSRITTNPPFLEPIPKHERLNVIDALIVKFGADIYRRGDIMRTETSRFMNSPEHAAIMRRYTRR